MGTTTNYGFPYPELTDPPDGPGAFQSLADAVDTSLGTVATTASGAEATATAAIPKSIVDAKGDLIVATSADTLTRVARGTNGQVLTIDTGEISGVTWATPASVSAATDTGSGNYSTTSTVFSTIDALLSVTVTVGTSGVLQVALNAGKQSSATTPIYVDFSLSGSNVRASSTSTALTINSSSDTITTYSKVIIVTGLSAGSTTIVPQFRALSSGSTASITTVTVSAVAF